MPDDSEGNTKLRYGLANVSWGKGGGAGAVSSMKTTEMVFGHSRTATKRAIRVWFYFVTIFILHPILRDKCTGKNTLA